MLLSYQRYVFVFIKGGESALHYASSNSHEQIVQLLIDADTECVNQQKKVSLTTNRLFVFLVIIWICILSFVITGWLYSITCCLC